MSPTEPPANEPSARGRARLADVAARAGVSRSLASLVIRGAPGPAQASREAVLRAAEELGYQPDAAAQRLRQHRSHLLGVLFTPGDPFHADLLEALHPAAEDEGFDLVLAARVPGRSEQRATEGLLRSRCEGLVLLGSEAEASQLRSLGAQAPVVLVSGRGGKYGLDGVETDDRHGIEIAVEHLVSLGHKHIRHIDGGRHAGSADRVRAYRSAMKAHGLTPDVVAGDHSEESGVKATRELLEQRAEGGPATSGVTAVLASNDRCAVGVLDTLRRAGVDVPGEISIVGYDDSRLARLTHNDLTTVAQDTDAMARLAVAALIGRAEGLGPKDVQLDARLVVRGTTAPPPPGA